LSAIMTSLRISWRLMWGIVLRERGGASTLRDENCRLATRSVCRSLLNVNGDG
jgi:hypothetical protein